MYNSFRLARQAENDIANITHGKLNADVHHGKYDILVSGKIKLEVKSATLSNNNLKFAFNDSGGRLKQKSDMLICVGYDSERKKIIRVLCIPSKKIPQWRSMVSLTINRKNKVRNIWEKYLVEPKNLLARIRTEYKSNKKGGRGKR